MNEKLVNTVANLPWVPIITVVGWIAFAVSFYFSTRATLETHSKEIARIFDTREKLLVEYTATQKLMAEGIVQLNQTVALRTQEANARSASLEGAFARTEVREDKIVQALDSLYQSQQELLRKLDRMEVDRGTAR